MKWYTCIIHAPDHINPVQDFRTRAESARQAVAHALRWIRSGEPEWWDGAWAGISVPIVFEGMHEPKNISRRRV